MLSFFFLLVLLILPRHDTDSIDGLLSGAYVGRDILSISSTPASPSGSIYYLPPPFLNLQYNNLFKTYYFIRSEFRTSISKKYGKCPLNEKICLKYEFSVSKNYNIHFIDF
jgi:hypothetical protein